MSSGTEWSEAEERRALERDLAVNVALLPRALGGSGRDAEVARLRAEAEGDLNRRRQAWQREQERRARADEEHRRRFGDGAAAQAKFVRQRDAERARQLDLDVLNAAHRALRAVERDGLPAAVARGFKLSPHERQALEVVRAAVERAGHLLSHP